MYGKQASQLDPLDPETIIRVLTGCGPLEREVTGKENDPGDGGGDRPVSAGDTFDVGVHLHGDIQDAALATNDPANDQNRPPSVLTLNQFNDDHAAVDQGMALLVQNGMARFNDAAWFLDVVDVVGAVTLDDTLTVTGATVLDGSLECNGQVDFDADVDVNSTITVTGAAVFDGQVDTNADVDINSTITVTGAAVFDGQVDTNADVDINSTITVTGAAVFDGQVDTNADVDINSTITVTGAAVFDGSAEFNGQVDFDADVDVNSTSTFTGAAVFNGSATFNSTVTGAGVCETLEHTIDYTDFASASTDVTYVLSPAITMSSAGWLVLSTVDVTTTFSGGGAILANMDFGHNVAATAYASTLDMFASTGLLEVSGVGVHNLTASTQTLQVVLHSDVNCDTLTQGSAKWRILAWRPS